MRSLALLGLSVLACFLANEAVACTPTPGWPSTVSFNPAAVARVLTRSATFIDIVEVTAITEDAEVGTSPVAIAGARANLGGGFTDAEVSDRLRAEFDDAVRLHYRVVQSLNRPGPSHFTLNGVQVARQSRVRNRGAMMEALRRRLDTADLSEWPGFGACITPPWGAVGGRYLVFRDRKGKLLKQAVAVRHEARDVSLQGPVVMDVASDNDPWVSLVRRAIADHKEAKSEA